MIELLGFHGTNFENTISIIKHGFIPSRGEEHWLGDGIYFFIEGLSTTPEIQAENWAIAQAWDNRNKRLTYGNFVVFEAKVQVNENECLDLRTSDGVEVFQYFIDRFITQIKSLGKNLDYLDGLILNFASKEGVIPFRTVIGNFYIKFTRERIERLNLRVQNCTICNVLESNPSILSYKVIKTGTIS